MKKKQINDILILTLQEYCNNNSIDVKVDDQTPLIGEKRILDSLGLVNVIIDIETTLLEKGIDISLTSEAAMSAKLSPFRSLNALGNFIIKQLEPKENE